MFKSIMTCSFANNIPWSTVLKMFSRWKDDFYLSTLLNQTAVTSRFVVALLCSFQNNELIAWSCAKFSNCLQGTARTDVRTFYNQFLGRMERFLYNFYYYPIIVCCLDWLELSSRVDVMGAIHTLCICHMVVYNIFSFMILRSTDFSRCLQRYAQPVMHAMGAWGLSPSIAFLSKNLG